MRKGLVMKIATCALATALMGTALVYYNFIDKPVPSVEPGARCPNFSVNTYKYNESKQEFETLTETVSVSDYLGKVLVVNFWSTTCGSCMEEMPHFDEFQKDYIDDVVILALDGEIGWPYEKVCKWMNLFRTTKGMMEKEGKVTEMYQWDTFDITFGYYPESNDVGEMLGFSRNWPSTAIIDKNGFIKYKHQGVMSYEDLEDVITPML